MLNDVLDLQRLPELESIGLTEFWATLTTDDQGCMLCTNSCCIDSCGER
jgi:hypothetical protein